MMASGGSACAGAIENGLRRLCFRAQSRPGRNLVVPFDQAGDGAGPGDHACIECPDGIGYGRVMRVDEKRSAGVVLGRGVSAEMNLTDEVEWKGSDIGFRVEPVIGGRYEDVVDVEKQSATRAPRDLGEELGLRNGALGKEQIGRRVFEKHLPAQGRLHLIDMARDALERFLRVG